MALTCELCGETDFLKKDGVFVCQSCGTKYSLEEAKKLMGTSEEKAVKKPAKKPVKKAVEKAADEQTIPSYLASAEKAYNQNKFNDSLSYCDKILKLDSKHSRAWFLKGSSIGNLYTFDHVRTQESIVCYNYALEYVEDYLKKSLEVEICTAMWKLSLYQMGDVCRCFTQDPLNYLNSVLWYYEHFESVAYPFIQEHYDQPVEYVLDISAFLMNTAAETYNNMKDYRFEPQYFQFYSQMSNCVIQLLDRYIQVSETSDSEKADANGNIATICCELVEAYLSYEGTYEDDPFLQYYYQRFEETSKRYKKLIKSAKKESSPKPKAAAKPVNKTKNSPETKSEQDQPKGFFSKIKSFFS